METFRELIEILNTNVYTGEIRESKLHLMRKMLLILIVVTAVMSVINIHSACIVEVTSLLMCAGFSFCLFLLKKYQNKELVTLIFAIIVCFIFSYYFIDGSSKGFSCLWLIVLPYAVMSSVDLKYGLYISSYFLVFLVIFCWTPAKSLLQYDYYPEFLIRFPILYIFSMLVSVRVGYQLQKSYIQQLSRINDLHEAVKAERDKNMTLAMQTIVSISHAVDAKDAYTSEHSERVAKYSKMIAAQLGWDKEELERIYIAGLIHDIGKIGIPDAILKKPGKLTDEEFACIKQHPEMGYHILKGYDAITGVTDAVLYHHERYDGNGYPSHLKGTDIPVFARIIAVADAFDAMSSNRIYRDALDKDYILNQLEEGKGKQFDPTYAEILIQLIKSGQITF